MKKKIIVCLVLFIVISLIYGFDYYRSKQFEIQIVSVSPQPAFADGQSPITIRVRLSDKQKNIIEGHSLFAYTLGGGVFKANREITNKNGEAFFTYFPYKASELMQLEDVPIEIIDESNSVIFEINTRKKFYVKLTKPEKKQHSQSTIKLEDVFGEK